MKKENNARLSLILSIIAFTISIFSLVITYGLFIEIKNLEKYILKPQATISPSTAIFSTIIGKFFLINSSYIIAIIVLIILVILIIIFRKVIKSY
jgi:hypothetical protein